MRRTGPRRGALGCANLAHGFAACGVHDKAELRADVVPNLAIVTAYNDMLSAHQPYESVPGDPEAGGARGRRRRPGRGRRAGHVRRRHAGARRHGDVAVLARRHRALGLHRAVARHVRRRRVSRHLRQDRAGPRHRGAGLWPSAGGVRAGGADAVRHLQRPEIEGAPALRRGQGRPAPTCSRPRPPPIMRREPAPSTARPTPTRC